MSNSICIDASLVISILFKEIYSDKAIQLLNQSSLDNATLITSSVFDAEVTSVIRKNVYFKKVTPENGAQIYRICTHMPVVIIDGKEVSKLAWELSVRYNFPRTYDMQYLAVAEINDCKMWTTDKRLVNSLLGKNSRVKFIGDF